jgi:ribosome biogenesis GTPase
MTEYGYTGSAAPEGQEIGRVLEFRRDKYTVMTPHGEASAVLRGAFLHGARTRSDLPTVGDFVLLTPNDNGPWRVDKLLPRHSKFSRLDEFGHGYAHVKANREQVVAVNFDYVFIMTSLNRDFRAARLKRYLKQTLAGGGTPVIILTKCDICEDAQPYINEAREAAPGVPVHTLSTVTGQGIAELSQYLQPGKTIVFLGMSGVGKSSLLNALAGDELATVRQTRNVDAAKGAHTTTHRQLFRLPSGALVIDTPGMRLMGLIDTEITEATDDKFRRRQQSKKEGKEHAKYWRAHKK